MKLKTSARDEHAAQIGHKINAVLITLQGHLLRQGPEILYGVSVDSRETQEGNMFFCLKGSKVDGHAFAGDAVKKGAAAVVIAKNRGIPEGCQNVSVIEVLDPFEAMRNFAAYCRSQLTCPVIGVTGSNGKTTTKEMIASILCKAAGDSRRVLKSEGNKNTDIGMALTLSRMFSDYHYCVLEMAMRGSGQIKRLAEIASPIVGAITNIGPAHIEFLGSLESIACAKGELLEALPHEGHAVYPIEEESRFKETTAHILPENRWSFGALPHAKVRIVNIQNMNFCTAVRLEFLGEKLEVILPFPGAHHARNAACAVAVSLSLGIPQKFIREGLQDVVLPGQCTAIYQLAGRWILDDCYNANPASMRAALQTVSELAAGEKIYAILGDMLELGVQGPAYHREIGAYAASLGIEGMIGVGALSGHILKGGKSNGCSKTYKAQSPGEAAEVIASWSQPGDWILVKASRGIHLEQAIEKIRELIL